MSLITLLSFIIILLLAAVAFLLKKKSDFSLIKNVVQNLPTGAILLVEGKFFINKGVERITGYTQDDFPDFETWFQKLYGDRAPEIMSLYHSCVGTEQTPLVQVRRKDGEYRQVIFNSYRDKIRNWEVWTLNDVTQHLEDAQKFKILFDHASDGHIIFDEAGVSDCNPMTLKLLGLTKKEEFLNSHPAFFSPEYQPCGTLSSEKSKRMDAIALEKGTHTFEWVHKRINGEVFPVLVTLTRVEINSKNVLFVIWHDLSEIKKNQDMVNYTAKMSALGEMAAGLAHELNNPLAIIKGSVYIMQMTMESWEQQLRDQVQKQLLTMDSTITRMTKIIKGLRDFSRQTRNDEPFEIVVLNDVVQETLNFCSARFKNHSIILKVDIPENIQIKCRSVEISQVLLNLLNNSCDAVMNLDNKWISITAQSRGNIISILVSDSGNGIPMKIAEKIMEPFYTTKGPQQGTGLGLSISKNIVERHLGKLSVRHDMKNTTFEIVLPSPLADCLAS